MLNRCGDIRHNYGRDKKKDIKHKAKLTKIAVENLLYRQTEKVKRKEVTCI